MRRENGPSAFARELGAARRERFVRSAGEVALLAADRTQHAVGDGDVLGFAAVRRTGQREFLLAPAELVESARGEKRQHLEELRARSPHRDERRVARHRDDSVPGTHDGRVHAMARFDAAAARDDDVE